MNYKFCDKNIYNEIKIILFSTIWTNVVQAWIFRKRKFKFKMVTFSGFAEEFRLAREFTATLGANIQLHEGSNSIGPNKLTD